MVGAAPFPAGVGAGASGSGETPPYGDTITSIRDALAQKWRGKGTVRQVYLNYPAADPHTLQNTPLRSLLFADVIHAEISATNRVC